MSVPSYDEDVTQLYFGLRHTYMPAYDSFLYGYLYSTRGHRRRVVAIPVRHGVVAPQSVDDLAIENWIEHGPMQTGDPLQKMVDTYPPPPAGVLLPRSYTIIYVGHRNHRYTYPNLNLAIQTRGGQTWYGNILVVKHGINKLFINVVREDGALVDKYCESVYSPRYSALMYYQFTSHVSSF
ncbi:hypothetical protein C8J57DRAFT_1537785 [Mycena rebaudengoi]|nr:hypothetical protein C8J57DRAFT_1537785 [Mycena rebaudengoi]